MAYNGVKNTKMAEQWASSPPIGWKWFGSVPTVYPLLGELSSGQVGQGGEWPRDLKSLIQEGIWLLVIPSRTDRGERLHVPEVSPVRAPVSLQGRPRGKDSSHLLDDRSCEQRN